MAFEKKTWQNRVSEYANRRRLIDSSNNETVVTVQRYEGMVTQEGDAFNAANMNDLEDRIDAAISDAEAAAGTVRSVRIQATAPVTSSTDTAQTENLNTTIGLANGYGDTKSPYASKTQNRVLASPNGTDGIPSFRALAPNDFPVGHGDTTNPYSSKTKNTVLAAPNGSNGSPSFRALVAADIPSLGNINHNGDITSNVAIASGDRLVINDESASKINNSSITFGTSTTTFLANNGTWQTPSAPFGLNPSVYKSEYKKVLTYTWTADIDCWITKVHAATYHGLYINNVMVWGNTSGSWTCPPLIPLKRGQTIKLDQADWQLDQDNDLGITVYRAI